MSNTCKVCTAPDQEDMERAGLDALQGSTSWRAAAIAVGLGGNYASLKNHMLKHYTAREVQAAQDEMDRYIEEAVLELQQQFVLAPPEVKPLLLAAIHNVRELKNTKPSQQHLIQALKTAQEMTGMKQEQRMMLMFAERMFGEVEGPKQKAIEAEVLDVSPLPPLDETAFASTTETER